MLCLGRTNGVRPEPNVDVRPPPLETPSASGLPRGLGPGTPTSPVSPAYAKAFLDAILPQFTDYADRIGLPVKLPITTNDVDFSRYDCRTQGGDVDAQVFLKNGDRFNYHAGHVAAFYAHDAFERFPFVGNPADFAGKINMTTNQAFAMAGRAVRNIGYHDKLPEPFFETRRLDGTNQFSRLIVHWAWPGTGMSFGSCEIDMQAKLIKGFSFDEKSLWRDPPKINVPMTEQTNLFHDASKPSDR